MAPSDLIEPAETEIATGDQPKVDGDSLLCPICGGSDIRRFYLDDVQKDYCYGCHDVIVAREIVALEFGGFHLDQVIDEVQAGLADMSRILDAGPMERVFSDERIFKADQVDFLGKTWECLLNVTDRRIYRIALSADGSSNTFEAASSYFLELYGKPAERQSNKDSIDNIWKFPMANLVVSQYQPYNIINIVVTSRTPFISRVEEDYSYWSFERLKTGILSFLRKKTSTFPLEEVQYSLESLGTEIEQNIPTKKEQQEEGMELSVIDQIVNHLEFLGYEVEKEDGWAGARHARKLNFCFKECNGGVLLSGLYSSNDFAKDNKGDYLNYINLLNRQATIARISADDKGSIWFEAWFPGMYEKKQFANFMDLWDFDTGELLSRSEPETTRFLKDNPGSLSPPK